jgi:hypothetical protein
MVLWLLLNSPFLSVLSPGYCDMLLGTKLQDEEFARYSVGRLKLAEEQAVPAVQMDTLDLAVRAKAVP